MKIEERKSEYTDENGKKHRYSEIVQINEDGTEVIRATIDSEFSDKEPQTEITEPTNSIYDEIKSIINRGEYTKDDLFNKVDTLFVMNRLTPEQYKELSGMINLRRNYK